MGHLDGKHTLTITKTSVKTFGNYSCVAKNSLGTFKKHIEVRVRSSKMLWWELYEGPIGPRAANRSNFRERGKQAGTQKFSTLLEGLQCLDAFRDYYA